MELGVQQITKAAGGDVEVCKLQLNCHSLSVIRMKVHSVSLFSFDMQFRRSDKEMCQAEEYFSF